MLYNIMQYVRAIAKSAKRAPKSTAMQPKPLDYSHIGPARMHPAAETFDIGGTDYPVFYLHNSKKLPHVLVSNTFVSLPLGKK
jgi:hypothetical protein